jgi:hypothetical protein
MKLSNPANLVRVPGHAGPHPELYHQIVFDRITQATKGLVGPEYSAALREELSAIGQEAISKGSLMNDLLTGRGI